MPGIFVQALELGHNVVERFTTVAVDIQLQIMQFAANLAASPVIGCKLDSITNLDALSNNSRFSSLAMNFGKTCHRDRAGTQHILKDITHTDAFKLTIITDHNEAVAGLNGLNKAVKQISTNHGYLIKNNNLLRQWMRFIVSKAFVRLITEQTVDGKTFPHSNFRHACGGTTGKCCLGKRISFEHF